MSLADPLARLFGADLAPSEFLDRAVELEPDERELAGHLWALDREGRVCMEPTADWISVLAQAPSGSYAAKDLERVLGRANSLIWSADLDALLVKLPDPAGTVSGLSEALQAGVAFVGLRQNELTWSELPDTQADRIARGMVTGEFRRWLPVFRDRVGDARAGRLLVRALRSAEGVGDVELIRFCLPYGNPRERVEMALALTDNAMPMAIDAFGDCTESVLELFVGRRITLKDRLIGRRPKDLFVGPMGLIGPLGLIGACVAIGGFIMVGPIRLSGFVLIILAVFLLLRAVLLRGRPPVFGPERVQELTVSAAAAAQISAWVRRQAQAQKLKINPTWEEIVVPALSQEPAESLQTASSSLDDLVDLAASLYSGAPSQRQAAYERILVGYETVADAMEAILIQTTHPEVHEFVAASFLNESLAARHRWLPAKWRAVCLSEPMREHTQRVLWAIYDGYDVLTSVFRVDASLELVDVHDKPFQIPPFHTIGVADMEASPPESRMLWMEQMVDYEIVSLVPVLEVTATTHAPNLTRDELESLSHTAPWCVDHDGDITLIRPFPVSDCTALLEYVFEGDVGTCIGETMLEGVHFSYPHLPAKLGKRDERNALLPWCWSELQTTDS